jgi:hypothetical protein
MAVNSTKGAQALFGVIRQTITPTSMRQIQFALKYNF